MRLIQSGRGISRLVLILLFVVSFILGALLSYVYVMGFYFESEFRLPKKSGITIENVEVSVQDTSFIDVTILNPSYSSSNVNLSRIEVRTPDDGRTHSLTDTDPRIPYLFKRGESQTFKCKWNWANYTGISRLPYTLTPIEIRAFLEDGRGTLLEFTRPLTSLYVIKASFNSSISVTHFNVTVLNSDTSATYVNITKISIDGNSFPPDNVTPSLPLPSALMQGDSVAFQCFWNWTDFQNESVTISVSTFQGYMATFNQRLPEPVNLNITEIVFNATISSQQFNVTVANAPTSPSFVDVSNITVSVNQSLVAMPWAAYPSSRLEKNSSVLLVCTWDWSGFQGKSLTAKISVYTSQGFIVTKEVVIP